jgi:hypothetical protein
MLQVRSGITEEGERAVIPVAFVYEFVEYANVGVYDINIALESMPYLKVYRQIKNE